MPFHFDVRQKHICRISPFLHSCLFKQIDDQMGHLATKISNHGKAQQNRGGETSA